MCRVCFSCMSFMTFQCGNGHDDATITKLQKEIKMVKISQDYSKIPDWLEVDKSYAPDFVVADPKKYFHACSFLNQF